MINNFNKDWKRYILNERAQPDTSVWVQSLKDNLSMLRPRTVRESKRVELMKYQLNEIRKGALRLQNEVKILQEENQLLQETKDNEQKSDKKD